MIHVASIIDSVATRRGLIGIAILSMLVAASGQADNRVQFTTGFIAAVGVEIDENGHPMLAEYDADGFFVADVGYLGLGDLEDITLYRASDWRAFDQLHRDLQSNNREQTDGATLMSAEQYRSRNFRTRGGRALGIIKPELRDDTKSVYVISERRMFSRAPSKENFIIAEYPIALHQGARPAADDVTLMLNDKGEIVRSSKYDVSVKAAIYKEEGRRSNDGFERLWQPIAGADVSAGDADINQFPGGRAVSFEDGRYSMTYVLPPCPGFSYELNVPIIATLNIENFNPKAEEQGFLSALRSDPKVCVGYGDVSLGSSLAAVSAQLNAQAIVATLATPLYKIDVTISTMQLNGLGTISEVPLTDQTRYVEENVDVALLEQGDYRFDFNLDGQDDTIRINADDNNKVDVWISPKQPTDERGDPVPPDFTRLADYDLIAQLEDQGMLGEISQSDLEDTDVYVYRRSTGQLIGSIEGLTERRPHENTVLIPGSPNPEGQATYRGVHTDEPIATFGFTTFLVGAVSNDTISRLRFDQSRVGNNRRPTQPSDGSAGGFASDRRPEGLRPGEIVQVIAINRATGYMGSLDVEIQPSGTTLIPPNPIEMGPPNIKVIATREFRSFDEITGDAENQINIIGSEGAGLTSDNYVKIQTIWLARDGQVLPEGLPGFTGRVAISTGSSTEDFSGNFEIKPGYQTQLVQLNNIGDPRREHFYVQVIGEPISGNPDFGSSGAGEGRLQTRPEKYVPLRVPVFDEQETRLAEESLALQRIAGASDLPDRVDPIHRWVYRPELQFTTYELRRHQLELNFVDESTQLLDLSEASTSEVLDSLLGDNIEFIRYIADLDDPSQSALPLFGPDKQFVIALGTEEIEFDFDNNGQLRFNNTEHISRLSPIDIASVRLYLNNDSANVLWEYSSLNIEAAVDLNRDGFVDFITGEDSLEQPAGVPTDLTTPERPYRFWVNNDYDAVNLLGSSLSNQPCAGSPVVDGESQQICEVWDQRVVDERSNTSDMDMPASAFTHLERIDNYRDLEDFVPIKMRLTLDTSDPDYRLEIKGNQVSVNLFKGVWNDDRELGERAHSYIFNEDMTTEQFRVGSRSDSYLGYAGAGEEALVVESEDFEDWFDQQGIARFVMEGVEPTDSGCTSSFENCYLSIKLFRENELMKEARVYLDFNDVRDYYDEFQIGDNLDTNPNSDSAFDAEYDVADSALGVDPIANGDKKIDIYAGVAPDSQATKHYALLVHGWRMREAEKLHFGDTSFKRLYWNGYRGTMGSVKWPTGWLEKPSWVYGFGQARFVWDNQQNYDVSEAVARRAGAALGTWIDGFSGYDNLHIFAHSMGNVVVSEALRHSNGPGVSSYTPMQAAEVAGSYYVGLGEVQHKLQGTGIFNLCFSSDAPRTAEEAWRCYNTDNFLWEIFDMPPDKYRYDVPLRHGATTFERMAEQNNRDVALPAGGDGLRGGDHYYKTISGRAGRVVNLMNPIDAALTGWELNQLAKPDFGFADSAQWKYEYEPITCAGLFDACDVGDLVEDQFLRAGWLDLFYTEIEWSETLPIQREAADVMGHILPARTEPLGQSFFNGGEIGQSVRANLTNSNQDHSAQFHGYLSEERQQGRVRLFFWEFLMDNGFAVDGGDDLSGLRRLSDE